MKKSRENKETNRVISMGNIEIVSGRDCRKCFFYGGQRLQVKKSSACKFFIEKLMGIDCVAENVMFKKICTYKTCSPLNTKVGDIVYIKEPFERRNAGTERVVKYVYPEDSGKFGFAILRNEHSIGKETECLLNNYEIEQESEQVVSNICIIKNLATYKK